MVLMMVVGGIISTGTAYCTGMHTGFYGGGAPPCMHMTAHETILILLHGRARVRVEVGCRQVRRVKDRPLYKLRPLVPVVQLRRLVVVLLGFVSEEVGARTRGVRYQIKLCCNVGGELEDVTHHTIALFNIRFKARILEYLDHLCQTLRRRTRRRRHRRRHHLPGGAARPGRPGGRRIRIRAGWAAQGWRRPLAAAAAAVAARAQVQHPAPPATSPAARAAPGSTRLSPRRRTSTRFRLPLTAWGLLPVLSTVRSRYGYWRLRWARRQRPPPHPRFRPTTCARGRPARRPSRVLQLHRAELHAGAPSRAQRRASWPWRRRRCRRWLRRGHSSISQDRGRPIRLGVRTAGAVARSWRSYRRRTNVKPGHCAVSYSRFRSNFALTRG